MDCPSVTTARSDLHVEARRSTEWTSFYQQLDQQPIDKLLSLGLDLLASYALIKSHPEIGRYLAKPLILLLATYYRCRFESLDIPAGQDFKTGVPRLFGSRDKLSKGQIRTLARINYREQATAIKAARHVVSDFQMVQRCLPRTGEVEGGFTPSKGVTSTSGLCCGTPVSATSAGFC